MDQIILSHDTGGSVLTCAQGVSLWGSRKILVIPTSRGSCSGSGVLLDLNGHALAVLVLHEDEGS